MANKKLDMVHTTNMNIDLLIYHGGCPDGTASAWCFWQSVLGKSSEKLFYGKHGEMPPNITNKHIVFVDFTFPKKEMEEILEKAASVLVLDHHKTSLYLIYMKHPKLTTIIDMNRSGAQIAWDYLNPDVSRPWYIDDIADRDLWKWSIPDSKHVCSAMNTLGHYMSMESFDLIQMFPRSYFVQAGQVILVYEDSIIQKIMKTATLCELKHPDNPKSWKVKLVECDHNFSSEVGNRLVSDGSCDFSIMYRYDFIKREWWLSCRADPKSDIDLTEILRIFDSKSGGHPKAAGMCIRESDGNNLHTYLYKV